MRGPEAPSGWPIAIAPPFWLTRLSSNGQFEPAQTGENLGGKGLVDLDHVDVGEGQAGARQRLFRRLDRADPHDPRRHPGDAAGDDAGERLGPGGVAGLAAGDDHRHRAVIDARGVAGGGDAALLQRPQPGERGQIGLRARMLVLADLDRPGAAARHLDRDDFALEEPVGLAGGVFALRPGGEHIGRPRG